MPPRPSAEMPSAGITLVVLLRLDPDRLDDYERFESEATRIMGTYGGRIERRVGLRRRAGDSVESPQEVHVVTFPSDERFRDYTMDARLQGLAALRERAIISTEIWHGGDLPPFGPPNGIEPQGETP